MRIECKYTKNDRKSSLQQQESSWSSDAAGLRHSHDRLDGPASDLHCAPQCSDAKKTCCVVYIFIIANVVLLSLVERYYLLRTARSASSSAASSEPSTEATCSQRVR